jgi:hypothetical protein
MDEELEVLSIDPSCLMERRDISGIVTATSELTMFCSACHKGLATGTQLVGSYRAPINIFPYMVSCRACVQVAASEPIVFHGY